TTVRAAMKVMMNPNKARRASGAGSMAIGADTAAGLESFGIISVTTVSFCEKKRERLPSGLLGNTKLRRAGGCYATRAHYAICGTRDRLHFCAASLRPRRPSRLVRRRSPGAVDRAGGRKRSRRI